MATREPDRPLQRWVIARGRSASLPLSYTTTRDTTDKPAKVAKVLQVGLSTFYRHFPASERADEADVG